MYGINHFLAIAALASVIATSGCQEPSIDEQARGPSSRSGAPKGSFAPSAPLATAAPGQPPIGSAAKGETFGEPRTFAGRVEATLEAGHYTYFLLQIGEGDERWVVVAGSEHRSAEHLTVEAFARQREFASRRLGRSFPELYFASVIETSEPGEE